MCAADGRVLCAPPTLMIVLRTMNAAAWAWRCVIARVGMVTGGQPQQHSYEVIAQYGWAHQHLKVSDGCRDVLDSCWHLFAFILPACMPGPSCITSTNRVEP